MTAPDLDARIMASLTGRAKLEALLTEAGYPTVRSIAYELRVPETDVSKALSGHDNRPALLRIRQKIAKLANLSRADVDKLLDAKEGK